MVPQDLQRAASNILLEQANAVSSATLSREHSQKRHKYNSLLLQSRQQSQSQTSHVKLAPSSSAGKPLVASKLKNTVFYNSTQSQVVHSRQRSRDSVKITSQQNASKVDQHLAPTKISHMIAQC